MNSARIKECTELSSEILKNFELSELPVSNIILKCLRLCRLLGDEDGILLFSYESSGYPKERDGLLNPETWRIAGIAGRRYTKIEKKDGVSSTQEYAQTYFNVVGSDLRSIGERLDAINDAVCKGTHVNVSKDEASRYIIHTYLLVSDIISLMD